MYLVSFISTPDLGFGDQDAKIQGDRWVFILMEKKGIVFKIGDK